MSDRGMSDIYSAENIARSRARAAGIRRMVADGELEAGEWLQIADDVEAYALERERAERRFFGGGQEVHRDSPAWEVAPIRYLDGIVPWERVI